MSIVQVIHMEPWEKPMGEDKDAFVMKLDSSGNLQWVTQLGGTTTATGGNNSGNG